MKMIVEVDTEVTSKTLQCYPAGLYKIEEGAYKGCVVIVSGEYDSKVMVSLDKPCNYWIDKACKWLLVKLPKTTKVTLSND